MNELKDFANVPYHIISPKDGKPIIEVVQDTMLGSFRLTKDHVLIQDKTFANLQMVNSYFMGKLPDTKNYQFTGRQASSAILPPGLHLTIKNRLKETVKIVNGEHVSGIIDKNVFHAMSQGLLPVIFHDYSPFEVRRYLDNLQRLICRWLLSSGFSVGISDLVVEPATKETLNNIIFEMKSKAYDELQKVRNQKQENNSILSNRDYFEQTMINILNGATGRIEKNGLESIQHMVNRMMNMVRSGSKGKDTNVAQMIACVGQQNVDGRRVSYGFTDRTLPHYTKFDDGPEARGFVENSFISGLTPQEMFFHAMGGREGLIDTAVKSVTGDTPLIVLENGKPRYVEIGDWIDKYMEKYPREIEVDDNRPDLEFLRLDDKVQIYIPTVDDKGNASWGQLTAVTRHDPTDVVYEVETAGGRVVTVADSESLLIWNDNKKEFLKKHSSLVVEGDYVPVALNMPAPPCVTEYVDMADYFPKEEYVHGTEFNKCVKLMREAQGDKFRIPTGWYEDNNGKTFTLPYTSKARVQRVTVRSNTENIKDGCIYPYHATREHSHLPDKFVLDYENGVFIGLFLADGCIHEKSGTVSIAKEDRSVQEFVEKWFDRYHITHRIDVCKKERGISTSVIGSTTLFARFLKKFVGHGSRVKHIPDVAYTAPDAFVKGLLSGYISGDGSIANGGIRCSSVSRRLTEGIAFLCSRIGVFGKISTTHSKSNNLGTEDIAPMHNLSIRAQWARHFARSIDLIHETKNEAMKNNRYAEEHKNFKEANDMVKDTIVKMVEVDGLKKCTKMYDVTVPSTLNFVTSSGLGSRDTSETGYLQRRLVKAMEDAKVHYDNTVRNAANSIIQFMYGEDGIEGTKIENQFIPTIEMDVLAMRENYYLDEEDPLKLYLTDEAYKQHTKSVSWKTQMENHFQSLLDDRNFLIHNIFNLEQNNKIQYPIPFTRLIQTAYQRAKDMGIESIPSNLTPKYVFDTIDTLINTLYITQKEQGTRFLHILLRTHLSPKPLLTKYHMQKETFDWLCDEIRRYFKEAIAPPGEMVGIIAAQSLGEYATQLSVHKDAKIIIMHKDQAQCFNGKVSTFIDNLMAAHPDKINDLGHDSTALYVPDDYYIVSVTNDERTNWRRILEVSRHPANGGLVTVRTKSGRQTTATLSHSFLKRTKTGIEPIEGGQLQIGDRIPIARYIPTVDTPFTTITLQDTTFTLDKALGYTIGSYLHGETIKLPHLLEQEFSQDNLPGWVFATNKEFMSGLYEACSTSQSVDMSLLSSYLKALHLQDDQILTIAVEDHLRALNLPIQYPAIDRSILQSYIDDSENPDIQALKHIVNNDIVWDEIVDIQYQEDPQEFVYDFTVPGNDSFMVDNGILVHNTLDSFHVSGTAAAVKATSGVPRLKELLSVSKNIKTPTLQIYLKPDISQTVDYTEDSEGKINDPRVMESKERVFKILHQLEMTKLNDLLDSTEIYWDPPGNAGLNSSIEQDNDILAVYREFAAIQTNRCTSTSPWVLRMKVNREKLKRSQLTMLDIYMKIFNMYSNTLDCIFSDDNEKELIFHMRLQEAALRDIDSEDMVAALKAIEYNITHTILLKGIPKIKKVSMRQHNYVRYNDITQRFEKVSEWVMDTDGSNFIEMMSHPNVDPYRTMSNDVYEIYTTLGIEAARNALNNEIMEVMRDSSVNYRHLSLLIDTMTCKGALMSIDRHGINRGDVGPLAKSSFEETTDMLIKASIFSEQDRINGVSANIMLGQLPPCGTGDSEIVLDEEEFMNLIQDKISYIQEPIQIQTTDPCNITPTIVQPPKQKAQRKAKLPKITQKN